MGPTKVSENVVSKYIQFYQENVVQVVLYEISFRVSLVVLNFQKTKTRRRHLLGDQVPYSVALKFLPSDMYNFRQQHMDTEHHCFQLHYNTFE